jgi:hypothetical protein
MALPIGSTRQARRKLASANSCVSASRLSRFRSISRFERVGSQSILPDLTSSQRSRKPAASSQTGRRWPALTQARAAGAPGDSIIVKAELLRAGLVAGEQARMQDFSIVPIMDRGDGQRSIVEDVVFGSGRPVITFQPGRIDLPTRKLGLVAIAWDGSRTAARSLADAMPLCEKAGKVRFSTGKRQLAPAPAMRPCAICRPTALTLKPLGSIPQARRVIRRSIHM